MSESVFSENLRIINAQNFLESVSGGINLYFTHGKSTAWANDAEPDQANTSVLFLNEIWNNMIGAKKLTGYDVRLAIRRYDWEANTSYPHYDSEQNSSALFSENNKFYIMTSDYNVYKCISNNNSSNSTVMPTHLQTTNAIEESDGYVWKYMYTLSSAGQYRFITENFIPIINIENDNGSLQWQVQNNAVDGALMAIKIANVGSGFTANNVYLSIVGDGLNANAYARVNTTSGQLSNVVITNKGSGYSYANVTIKPGQDDEGINAELKAIISPTGGHGSDPIRELGAKFVIVNARQSYDENDHFPVGNDFRQIALIQDPKLYGSSNVASGSIYSQYLTVILNSGITSFENDEIVYQGDNLSSATFRGRVLSYELIDGNYILKLVETVGTIKIDTIIGVTSGTSRFVESVENPELKKYSGKLLHTQNIKPITRSDDQIEDFKIIVKF